MLQFASALVCLAMTEWGVIASEAWQSRWGEIASALTCLAMTKEAIDKCAPSS